MGHGSPWATVGLHRWVRNDRPTALDGLRVMAMVTMMAAVRMTILVLTTMALMAIMMMMTDMTTDG